MRGSRHHQVAAVVCLLLAAACNEVPTAPEVVIVPAAPTSAEDLTVEVTTEATDDGRVLFYRTVWTRDGTHVLDLDDETTVPAAQTTRDEVWAVELTALDDELDIGEPGTAQVTIINSPPTAQVSISPTPALVYEDLVATIATDDPDGDPVDVSVSWTMDGVQQPELDDSSEVEASLTSPDETWVVTVVPNDGTDDGDPVSASVTIGADPRPPASTFCAGGGIATNSTTSAVLCASPLELATTPASNDTLVWYPGPIRAVVP